MKNKQSAGFTLIETVIALVLLSFITVIGYQGMVFGVEQWHKGHERMQFQYDYYQAIGWMRNKLGSAEQVLPFDGDRDTYQFAGEEHEVEFVARFDRARQAGLYVSRIYLDPRDNSLYVSYRLHHPDVALDPPESEVQRVKLLSEVTSLRISYYGRLSGSRQADWHTAWRRQNSLPQLLKFDFETVDGVNHESLLKVLTSNNV